MHALRFFLSPTNPTKYSNNLLPPLFPFFRTDNRHNKVVYFKEIGLWYLSEQPACNMGSKMLVHSLEKKNEWTNKNHGQGSPESIRNLCCMRDAYWKDNVEMKPVILTAKAT